MPTKNKPVTPVTGSERGLRSGSQLIGPCDPNERIEITIRLRSKAPKTFSAARLGTLLPGKRTYLTRDQFAKTYGAAPADIAKIKAFASKHKLEVTSESPGERNVKLAGTIGDVSAAFNVKLMEYSHSDGNYRGRIGAVHIPENLEKIVRGVFGLDSRRQARPHIAQSRASAHASHLATFSALQVAQLYNFPANTDGTGQCIAILEFGGGYSQSDLSHYFKKLGVAEPTITSVGIDGVSNSPGSDPDSDGEVALDIQVAGAIAPGAKFVVYFAPFTERGWVDVLSAAIHDKVNNPTVVSISWGFAEGEPVQGFEWTQQTVNAVNEVLQTAAALGVTVCVASGDDGSSDDINDGHAHVDFPASSPYSLGCGGTRLTGSGSKIADEVVWNDGPGSGGGGGISVMNPLPAWQQGIVPPSVNPGSAVGRGVPDVCGNADPDTGYQIYYGGKAQVVGGTSAVAPLWAALIARLAQGAGKTFGLIQEQLYAGVVSGEAAPGFQDITSGSNGAYSAGPGWDACSGLGSPDGTALLTELTSATGEAATPAL